MFKNFILFFGLLVYSMNISGCIFLVVPLAVGVVGGVGIGIGTAKWMSDKLVEQVPHPYAPTVTAAQLGIKDLSLDIIKETDTDKLSQISAKYTDDRTVWVTVANVSEKVSRIEVRVGVWGGQKDARKVLDAILSHL